MTIFDDIRKDRETGTARGLDLQVGDVVEYGGFEGAVTAVELIPPFEVFGGQTRLEFEGYGGVIFANETLTIISRATDTPQRYVVVTPTDTLICTRSEAEDLANGRVDAVYKLGDKVNVTVKVEFE